MGEVIQFIPRPDPDREERMTKRAIADAREIYDSIFPANPPAEPASD